MRDKTGRERATIRAGFLPVGLTHFDPFLKNRVTLGTLVFVDGHDKPENVELFLGLGLGSVFTGLQALGATLTTTIQFLLAFNLLVSHVVLQISDVKNVPYFIFSGKSSAR